MIDAKDKNFRVKTRGSDLTALLICVFIKRKIIHTNH